MELYENMFKRFLKGLNPDQEPEQDTEKEPDPYQKTKDIVKQMSDLVFKMGFDKLESFGLTPSDVEDTPNPEVLRGFDVEGVRGVSKESDGTLQGFDYGEIGNDAQFTWGYHKEKNVLEGFLLYRGYSYDKSWEMDPNEDPDKILDSFKEYLELVKKTMYRQYK